MSAPSSPTLRWVTAGLLLLGAALALALPFLSATLLTLMLGSAAVVAGISQLLRLTGAEDTRAKVFRGLSGLLYVLGGISLLLFPVQSTVSLTLFLGFLLAMEGMMELAAAAARAIPARSLVLVDGIVTTLLGVLLIAKWPSDSTWAIGTLFGASRAMSAVHLLTAPPPALPAGQRAQPRGSERVQAVHDPGQQHLGHGGD
ncbi:MAG: HdeD family acid-resistance protein, partial [Cyanobacteriota bacterium]